MSHLSSEEDWSEDEMKVEEYNYSDNFGYRLTKKFCGEFHTNLLVSFEVHWNLILNWMDVLELEEKYLLYLNIIHILGYMIYQKNHRIQSIIETKFSELLSEFFPFLILESYDIIDKTESCCICMDEIGINREKIFVHKIYLTKYHISCYGIFFQQNRILGCHRHPEEQIFVDIPIEKKIPEWNNLYTYNTYS